MIDQAISTPLAFRLARILCAVACFGMATPPAWAEKADRDKPINFQGDTGGGNAETKNGELAGNVVVTQGTLSIHADRITFHQNPDNSLSAVAYGNPVTFREKRDGIDEYYEGFAQRINYDGQKRFVELFDNALLKKGSDQIRSNYISYDAATEAFKAEGRPDSGPTAAGEVPLGARVRGVFQPEAKDGKNAKGAAGAPPAPKPNPSLPLKPDDKISPSAGK
ncbi:MAG TPA: lipopolysaccharide transport periplasmic protein LptA [Casimicrobiaceae bacterium]|jgi:lipopolysaccharide export system protein LptA